jgi:DNA-binding transcriptional LysR family regulator
MIDLRRLHVLQEVALRGTIAAAAEALHLTPSAVSQQITRLSQEIEAPLLVRQGRGVRLTEQAHLLLEHAAAIHDQLARARADLAAHGDGYAGRALVGAFGSAITAILAPVLTELGHRRPGIRLSVRETEAPKCFTDLDEGQLDLVVTVDYRGGPARTCPRYHRVDLLSDPLVLAVPAGHPLADRAAVELAAASAEPWITGAGNGPCGDVVAAACATAGFSPDIRHEVGEWAAAVSLVAAGAGVALVPRLALPAAPPGVAVRPLATPESRRVIYAATRAGEQYTPTLAVLLDLLSAHAAALSAEAEPDRALLVTS